MRELIQRAMLADLKWLLCAAVIVGGLIFCRRKKYDKIFGRLLYVGFMLMLTVSLITVSFDIPRSWRWLYFLFAFALIFVTFRLRASHESRRERILRIAVLCVTVVGIAIYHFPIRFAVHPLNMPSGKYYICEEQATTGPNWRIIGDENGMYESCKDVFFIEGDPHDALDKSVYLWASNYFIVYGEIAGEGDFGGAAYPYIKSTGFDMVYPIERGDSIRILPPRGYLTLSDMLWFWDAVGRPRPPY